MVGWLWLRQWVVGGGWWVVVIGLVVLMELAGFGVARSVFGWFGVARFGVVGFSGGANSLMKREVKMKQRSYNGNNSKLFWMWQCTGKGLTSSLNLLACHWTQFLSFENRWNLFSVLVTHIRFPEWQSDENGDLKLIQTSVEFWKQVGPTRLGWWKQKTEWYHSKLSSSKQALSLSFFFGLSKSKIMVVEKLYLHDM